ncbi:hypothetical protein ACHWQZ_G000259 [Mnemiopsis leidyi]
MNTHPYYPSNPLTNRYTQLALLLVSQSQSQNLSREEEEKRRVRRERNKVAATKCREKRKAHSVYVRHEYGKVTDTTRNLEEQILALKRERDELIRILDTHDCNNPSLERAAQGSQMCQQQQSLQYNPGQAQMISPSLTEMFIKSEPVHHY